MKQQILTGALEAVSVFLDNAPNRWKVKPLHWGAPAVADCGESADGETYAKLFAAAPDLLKTLQACAEVLESIDVTGYVTVSRTDAVKARIAARFAIAKAGAA